MSYFSKKRENMIYRQEETFKPPLLSQSSGVVGKILDKLRLFLDVQAGSIWRDLTKVLPHITGTVLDVGCGGCWYKRLFNAQKTNYIGIDTVESEKNFGYKNPEVLYYSGKTLPVENERADFILCTETLEHILEPDWLLAEMVRCLKSGGKILLTVPFAARWHFIPYDYWRYTPASLLHLLTQAGLTQVEVFARGNALTVACYKVMALILPLFFSKQNKIAMIGYRLLGLLLLPVLLLLALIANIAIAVTCGAEDCLGYTVLAEKPYTQDSV